jgi:hypothetical protein
VSSPGRRRACRFSKELSTRAAVTWADAERLIVLSQRLSHRSVIFFGQRPTAVVPLVWTAHITCCLPDAEATDNVT